MSYSYGPLLRAKFLLLRGKRQAALETIDQALALGPPPRAEVHLRMLKARTAGHLNQAMRAFVAIERGLSSAARTKVWQRDVDALIKLFDQLATGQLARARRKMLGDVRMLASATPKGHVVLLGLCPDVSSAWAQLPVRLFFEGHLVSEIRVAELDGGRGRGRFEFRIKRSTLAGLENVEIETAGQRHAVTRDALRELWPDDLEGARSETMAQLAQGYIVDSTGVLSMPKNHDDAWLRETFAVYESARRWLQEAFGYDLYLTGGTLLGYARSGEVISFDKDFDTGYLSKHTRPEDIRREYKEIIVGLLKSGHDVRLLTAGAPPRIRCDYFWLVAGNLHVDVFAGAFIEGKYRRPTFVDTQLTRDDFYPFEVRSLSGYEVVVPKNVEKKVEAVYGPGWRVPDPFWKKVRSPAIVAYREAIMLSPTDLLEIAKVSPQEGATIQRLVESGNFGTA